MIDLIGGLIACAALGWFVCVPLAWVSGTYDAPIDPAAKHSPRARRNAAPVRPPHRS
jgi:hypothetical protein